MLARTSSARAICVSAPLAYIFPGSTEYRPLLKVLAAALADEFFAVAEAGGLVGTGGSNPSTLLDVPGERGGSGHMVFCKGQIRAAFDRNKVVCTEDDELTQPQVTGLRPGLGRNSFLYVAIAGRYVCSDLLFGDPVDNFSLKGPPRRLQC